MFGVVGREAEGLPKMSCSQGSDWTCRKETLEDLKRCHLEGQPP